CSSDLGPAAARIPLGTSLAVAEDALEQPLEGAAEQQQGHRERKADERQQVLARACRHPEPSGEPNCGGGGEPGDQLAIRGAMQDDTRAEETDAREHSLNDTAHRIGTRAECLLDHEYDDG